DGLLWIAMELVRGTSLARLLRTQGALPLDRFVPLLERICEVVHTAHEQGIVHRDLKPDNVMVLTRAGRLLPKLLDLGIAKTAGVQEKEGARLGSPGYMAPEQWRAGEIDGRTDVYALGVMCFEALTGRLPFAGATLNALFDAHVRAPPPSLGPEFPTGVEAA